MFHGLLSVMLLVFGTPAVATLATSPQESTSEYSVQIERPDGQYGCSDWFFGIEGTAHEYFDPFLNADNPGIRVTRVLEGYPAHRMGVRVGDVVTSMRINGRDFNRFREMRDLVNALSKSRDGIAVVRVVPLSRGDLFNDRPNFFEKRIQLINRPVRLEEGNNDPFFP